MLRPTLMMLLAWTTAAVKVPDVTACSDKEVPLTARSAILKKYARPAQDVLRRLNSRPVSSTSAALFGVTLCATILGTTSPTLAGLCVMAASGPQLNSLTTSSKVLLVSIFGGMTGLMKGLAGLTMCALVIDCLSNLRGGHGCNEGTQGVQA